jgi:hypothetical protein
MQTLTYLAKLDFSTITIPTAGNSYRMRVEIICSDEDKNIDLTIEIGSNTTPIDVIDAIKVELIRKGYYYEVRGNNITIANPPQVSLMKIKITNYTTKDSDSVPIPDNTLAGPTLRVLAGPPRGLPTVYYNGQVLRP